MTSRTDSRKEIKVYLNPRLKTNFINAIPAGESMTGVLRDLISFYVVARWRQKNIGKDDILEAMNKSVEDTIVMEGASE